MSNRRGFKASGRRELTSENASLAVPVRRSTRIASGSSHLSGGDKSKTDSSSNNSSSVGSKSSIRKRRADAEDASAQPIRAKRTREKKGSKNPQPVSVKSNMSNSGSSESSITNPQPTVKSYLQPTEASKAKSRSSSNTKELDLQQNSTTTSEQSPAESSTSSLRINLRRKSKPKSETSNTSKPTRKTKAMDRKNRPKNKESISASASSAAEELEHLSIAERILNRRRGKPQTSNTASSSTTPTEVSNKLPGEVGDEGKTGKKTRSKSSRKNKIFGSKTSGDSSSSPTGRKGSKKDKGGKLGATKQAGTKSAETFDSLMDHAPSFMLSSLDMDHFDETEISRLHALLETRGLPPQIFGSFGTRFQQLMNRMSNSNNSKVQNLLQAMKSDDEGASLAATTEICSMLVMGNEETLTGFPIKNAVSALRDILKSGKNYDLMNHACRALTYMMEALPRSTSQVATAIPQLVDQLKSIECMDVAEQALDALETLSRRHGKLILHSNGIGACLQFIDFFSIVSQRHALAITANAINNVSSHDIEFVQPILPLLSSRLSMDDKKCVESVCSTFSKLVDTFRGSSTFIGEISAHGLIAQIQQLLVVTPPIISSGTFIECVRMLTQICAACPDMAIHLLNSNISETLCYLFTGLATLQPVAEGEKNLKVELTHRNPQEVYELTCLAVELIPATPEDGVFAVDVMLKRKTKKEDFETFWEWMDDDNNYQAYSNDDSKAVEAAYSAGDEESVLTIDDRQYSIDFTVMQQINDDTGTSRQIRRRELPKNSDGQGKAKDLRPEDPQYLKVCNEFIQVMFPVLYEVYGSTAGASIRDKCLHGLLRMTYHANNETLGNVIGRFEMANYIASMLASPDLRIVIGGFQMASVLMNRMQQKYETLFLREGVTFQLRQIAEEKAPVFIHRSLATSNASGEAQSGKKNAVEAPAPAMADLIGETTAPVVPKRKWVKKESKNVKTGAKEEKQPTVESDVTPPTTTANTTSSGMTLGSAASSLRSKLNIFTRSISGSEEPSSNAAPAPKEGMSNANKALQFLRQIASDRSAAGKSAPDMFNSSSASANARHRNNMNEMEKWLGSRNSAKAWLKEESTKFLDTHENWAGNLSPTVTALEDIVALLSQGKRNNERIGLEKLSDLLINGDASPFEIIQSKVVPTLLKYLGSVQWNNNEADASSRKERLMTFCCVFMNAPDQRIIEGGGFIDAMDFIMDPDNVYAFRCLVKNLNSCLNQLEQFPVRVNDSSTDSSSLRTSMVQFFKKHQIKCLLQRYQVKEGKAGLVRVDPLAPVQSIEHFLIAKGYARKGNETVADAISDHIMQDDESMSEDDISDNFAGTARLHFSGTQIKHKLELILNDNILPYNMTMFQAIKTYGGMDIPESETECEAVTLANAQLFGHTHTIEYREIDDAGSVDSNASGKGSSTVAQTISQVLGVSTSSVGSSKGKKGKKAKAAAKATTSKKEKSLVYKTGIAPLPKARLDYVLDSDLSLLESLSDPAIEVILLLRVLNAVNELWPEIYHAQEKAMPRLEINEFYNGKLVTKVNRQLQDPVIILTGQLPRWLVPVAVHAQYLLPFEARLQLFYVTSYDRDRAWQRLLDSNPEVNSRGVSNSSNSNGVQSEGNIAPRLEKRKRQVNRNRLFDDGKKLMAGLVSERHSDRSQLLEVQFEDEVGTGLGPTLEFYSLLSREFRRTALDIFHSKFGSSGDYVNSPFGLFPRPYGKSTPALRLKELRQTFRFLGQFMAKALMDFRILDLPLNKVFYKLILGEEERVCLADLATIDPELAKSLEKLHRAAHKKEWLDSGVSGMSDSEAAKQLKNIKIDGCSIEDLCLTFVLPGYDEIELCAGGKEKIVTLENVGQYVNLVMYWYLREGVEMQVNELREGFNAIFPLNKLAIFKPLELELVFCGYKETEEGWDVKTLSESCHPDHGYTQDSVSIKRLFEIMSKFSANDQREFLQFVTGCPKLPVGGFRALTPPLTIVRKQCSVGEHEPDDYLPSVMTCVNYLKLPEYSSKEVMEKRLRLAFAEGKFHFHLS